MRRSWQLFDRNNCALGGIDDKDDSQQSRDARFIGPASRDCSYQNHTMRLYIRFKAKNNAYDVHQAK
jgi:hypothetical protein